MTKTWNSIFSSLPASVPSTQAAKPIAKDKTKYAKAPSTTSKSSPKKTKKVKEPKAREKKTSSNTTKTVEKFEPIAPKQAIATVKSAPVISSTQAEDEEQRKRGRPSKEVLMARAEAKLRAEKEYKEQLVALDPNRKIFHTDQLVSISYPWGLTLTGTVRAHNPDSKFVRVLWDDGCYQAAPAESLTLIERKVKVRKKRGPNKNKKPKK